MNLAKSYLLSAHFLSIQIAGLGVHKVGVSVNDAAMFSGRTSSRGASTKPQPPACRRGLGTTSETTRYTSRWLTATFLAPCLGGLFRPQTWPESTQHFPTKYRRSFRPSPHLRM